MIYKRRLTIFLFAAAFLAVIFARLPASLIQTAIVAERGSWPHQLSDLQGTIWQPGTTLHGLVQPVPIDCHWDTGALFKGRPGYECSASIPGMTSHLQAQLTVFPLQQLNISNARWPISSAAPIYGRYGLSLQGNLDLDNCNLQSHEGTALHLTACTLAWQGGEVAYELADRWFQATFPPLAGTVTKANQLLIETADGAPLLQFVAMDSGWLQISATRRFLTIAGQPWQFAGPEDEWVLRIEEALPESF